MRTRGNSFPRPFHYPFAGRRSSVTASSSRQDSSTITMAAAITVRLMESFSPENIWRGRVRCAGPARNSTTTTSSRLMAKAKTAPAATPGAICGRQTRQKARAGLAPQAAAARSCTGVLRPGGLLLAGFGLDAEHLPEGCDPVPLADVDAALGTAGLAQERRWATWDGAPYDGGGYVVVAHRLPL